MPFLLILETTLVLTYSVPLPTFLDVTCESSLLSALLRVRHRPIHGVPAPRGAQGTLFNRKRLGFTEWGVLSVARF